MTLIDRKVPIITGINDVPSVNGDESHPNASLLCQKHNDLIDNELTAINNALSSIPSSNKPSAIHYDVYLNTSLPSNGDGTIANPFNTVSALVTELNSKLYNQNINVIIIGNTNLGSLNLTITTNGQVNDLPIKLNFLGDQGTETITIGSINTSITVNFDNLVAVNLTSIAIRGDVEFFVPISGTSIVLINGSMKCENVSNITLILDSSYFLSNGAFSNVIIDANHSDVFLEDVTGSVNLELLNSTLSMNNCNIDNTSGNVTLLDGLNSDIKLQNLTYLPSNPEELPIINISGATTLIAKTINFSQFKINGTGALTIVNNSII